MSYCESLQLIDGLLSGVVTITSLKERKGGNRGRAPKEIREGFILELSSAVVAICDKYGIPDCLSQVDARSRTYYFTSTPEKAKGRDSMGRICNTSLDDEYTFIASLKFLRGYMECLLDSEPVPIERINRDIPASAVFSFLERHTKLSKDHGSEVLTKILKFYTVSQSAHYLNQDLPKPPIAGLSWNFFTGRARTLISLLMRKQTHRAEAFFNGVLQGVKRGCHPVPVTFEDSQRFSHIASLAKEKLTDPGVLQILNMYADRLLVDMPKLNDLISPEPSGSATFKSSRKEGGQRNELMDRLLYPGIERYEGGPTAYLEKCRSHALVQPELYSIREVAPGVLKEIRSTPVPDKKDLRTLFEDNCQYRESLAREAGIPGWMGGMCRVAAISEPLKTRLITAGSGVDQYFGLALQGHMWKWMQTIPSLRLTGQPMDTTHISWVNDQTFFVKPGMAYVSGDFSAATDNLHMDVSELFLEAVLKTVHGGLDDAHYKDLCRSILLQQMIETKLQVDPLNVPIADTPLNGYPATITIEGSTYNRVDTRPEAMFAFRYDIGFENAKKIENTVVYVSDYDKKLILLFPQRNGQLMGSVLSFPILCMANLCSYWRALEIYLKRKVALKDLPVLVNGDDILFMADEALYAIWKKCVSDIGFDLSVGKNYFSDRFCMVNSQLYRTERSPSRVISGFRHIPFLNIGLLTGQAKVTGRSTGVMATPKTLDSYYNSLMKGAGNPVRAHHRFMFYNKEEIELESRKGLYNLFIDRKYGGLGFDLRPEIRKDIGWYMTSFQMRLSSYLYKEHWQPRRSTKLSPIWSPTNIEVVKDYRPLSGFKSRTSLIRSYCNFAGPLRDGVEDLSSTASVVPLANDLTEEMTNPDMPSFKSFPHHVWKRIEDMDDMYWAQGILTIQTCLTSQHHRVIGYYDRETVDLKDQILVEEFLADLF